MNMITVVPNRDGMYDVLSISSVGEYSGSELLIRGLIKRHFCKAKYVTGFQTEEDALMRILFFFMFKSKGLEMRGTARA